jgi:hypothetical protein
MTASEPASKKCEPTVQAESAPESCIARRVVDGRCAAKGQQQHRGDLCLLQSKSGGDAGLIVVAKYPVGPTAGRGRAASVTTSRAVVSACHFVLSSAKLKGR